MPVRGAPPLCGHHHEHHLGEVVDAGLARRWGIPFGALVKLRRSISGVPSVVCRVWPKEEEILAAVNQSVPNTPRHLGEWGDYAVHTYAPGRPVSALRPPSKTMPSHHCMRQLMAFFRRLARVDTASLPSPPVDWPEDGDSTGFLRRLVRLTEDTVHQRNRAEFGELFDKLGVPADAMEDFGRRIPPFTKRPFSLLHTDIHRDNLVMQPDGTLFLLDWELAMVGDPLHELATHLVRMKYPSDRARKSVIAQWKVAMSEVSSAATTDFEGDLQWYLDYEHAQSIYPDIIRAALHFEADPREAAAVAAVRQVRKALVAARWPLRIGEVQESTEIRRHLFDWASGRGGRGRRGSVDRWLWPAG
ncbi:MAG: hypothetical protein QOF84_4533 [Streptomyces sp.]|nr:hypothetical protein [Streptomyces sp.]